MFGFCLCIRVCRTCWEMRPQRCSSLPDDRAMLAAMAGGGLVFRLLQVQISWARACSVSIRSFTNSHWNVRGLRGVLAAWIHTDTRGGKKKNSARVRFYGSPYTELRAKYKTV